MNRESNKNIISDIVRLVEHLTKTYHSLYTDKNMGCYIFDYISEMEKSEYVLDVGWEWNYFYVIKRYFDTIYSIVFMFENNNFDYYLIIKGKSHYIGKEKYISKDAIWEIINS